MLVYALLIGCIHSRLAAALVRLTCIAVIVAVICILLRLSLCLLRAVVLDDYDCVLVFVYPYCVSYLRILATVVSSIRMIWYINTLPLLLIFYKSYLLYL